MAVAPHVTSDFRSCPALQGSRSVNLHQALHLCESLEDTDALDVKTWLFCSVPEQDYFPLLSWSAFTSVMLFCARAQLGNVECFRSFDDIICLKPIKGFKGWHHLPKADDRMFMKLGGFFSSFLPNGRPRTPRQGQSRSRKDRWVVCSTNDKLVSATYSITVALKSPTYCARVHVDPAQNQLLKQTGAGCLNPF